MNSKERMDRAMRLMEPDRVPVMCQMSIGHMLLQTACSPSEFWYSSSLFSRSLVELRSAYGFDGILVSLHGHPSDRRLNIQEMKTSESGESILWKNGDRTVFPFDDLPRHYPAEPAPSPVLAEVDPDSIPEDVDFIPVSQSLRFTIDTDHPYDAIQDVVAKAGQQFSVHGEVTSPFDYFLDLFGLNEALAGLLQHPDKSREILQRYTQSIEKIALGQVECGVDAIKISSPYAGSGFISPEAYRDFVLPFEKKIAQIIRGKGVHVYTHTCGAVADRLELMVGAGISGLECLDPPPLGNVRLEEAKKRIGNRVFIKGNVDPVNVLLKSSSKAVYEDAVHRIRVGMPGGGFILSTACSIAPRTPPENIRMLVKAAEQEGVYD